MTAIVLMMLMLIVLVAVRVLRASRLGTQGSFHVGALCGTLYFFVVPAFSLLMNGTLEVPDPSASRSYAVIETATDMTAIALATAMVTAFVILTMFTFVIDSAWESRAKKSAGVGSDNLVQMLSCSWLLLVCLILLYYFLVMRGASHWYLAKGEFFQASGLIGVAYQFLVFGLHLSTFALLAHCVSLGYIGVTWGGLALIVILLLDLLVIGNRIMVLAAALLLIFLLVNLRLYLLLAICALAGVFSGVALSAFPIFRYHLYASGVRHAIWEFYTLIRSGESSAFAAIFETVNVNVFVALVRDHDIQGAGLEYATFLKPLYAFIPRSLFEGKLDSITVLVGNLYDDRYGLALVPLIFGESYMNVGVFGPIILVLFCSMTHRFVHKAFPESVSPYIALMAGFLFVRFPFSDLFLFLLITVPVYFAIRVIASVVVRRGGTR